jgi:predicted nucleotidyltransferase/predicted transcriptional regulator
MDSDIKIMIFLLNNKEKSFTIRQISQETKINYRIAYEQIGHLEKEKLISIEKMGKSSICKLTYNFNSRVYLAELERREALFKNKEFKVIRNRLAELNFVFVSLLFGSYAKGTAKENSDIDILTIGGKEEEIMKALSLWGDKIHLTPVSEESFIRMAKSRDFNVVNEAIKNNIILIGIEEYYRLLNNTR